MLASPFIYWCSAICVILQIEIISFLTKSLWMSTSNRSFIWSSRTLAPLFLFIFLDKRNACSFYDEGYNDGFAHGQMHGLIEGRALGREKGYEMFEELGFYEGFAQTWKQIHEKSGKSEK